jgi:hypothetical protein
MAPIIADSIHFFDDILHRPLIVSFPVKSSYNAEIALIRAARGGQHRIDG